MLLASVSCANFDVIGNVKMVSCSLDRFEVCLGVRTSTSVEIAYLVPLLFLNDMASYIYSSKSTAKYANDIKCFTHIASISNHYSLQDEICSVYLV